MKMFLLLFSGIAWTIVYIDGIRVGFKQKTYAIPFWALAINIAWEAIHSILGFASYGVTAQIIVNFAWLLFDIAILVTYFKYGKQHFPKSLKKAPFIALSVFILGLSFIMQYMFVVEFTLVKGASYAAFIQNVLMSVLFIKMLIDRNSSIGQTKLIAYAKWLGTLAPTILFGIIGVNAVFGGKPNLFILVFGIICSVFDITYIVMLTKKQKEERLLKTR